MNNTKSPYCHLCAQIKPLDELKNLQTDTDLNQNVVNKLLRFNIVVNFSDNGQPRYVCLKCIKNLEDAHTFVIAVQNAQALLSNWMQAKGTESNSNNEGSDEEMVTVKEENIQYFLDVNIEEGTETQKSGQEDQKAKEDASILRKYLEVDNIPSSTNNSNESDKNDNGEEYKITVKKQSDLQCQNLVYSSNKSGIKFLKNCLKPATKYSAAYIDEQIENFSVIPINYIKETWLDFTWKCAHCETLFPNVDELQKHSMEFHSSCNPYQCMDCNRKKIRLDGFLKHMRIHRRYLHYSCYKCFDRFSSPIEARQHKAEMHAVTDRTCTGCNTTFSSKTALNKHVNTYYKNKWVKPKPLNLLPNDNFQCSQCLKFYASKTSLLHHLVTHTDRKKDFVCDVCGKSFYQKINLKNHMVQHDDSIVHQCEICKYSFKNARLLRDHAGVHSGIKPYKCDQCGKTFRTKKNLANHQITHTDIFPISCTQCEKKFRNKTHLKNHMVQHTGVRPFSCDVCHRGFTNRSNYHKHMKRKHGIEKAKTKRTPQGPLPVDPTTGEIVYPEPEKVVEEMGKMIQVGLKKGRQKNTSRTSRK